MKPLLAAARQSALDAAYREHPERFPHGAPRVPRPPAAVHINPLVADALSVLPAITVDVPSITAEIDARTKRVKPLRSPLLSAAIAP